MQDKSDAQLLREYAEHGSEAAFGELVARHTDLVYSAALRQVESPDLARDVAQSVFSDLARKARSLAGKMSDDASLVGWLYRSTRFAALTQLRDDRRRQSRERLAMQHLDSTSEASPDWERVRPVLDEAMANLSDEDRDALLLRFFKSQDFRSVGAAIGLSDDAAQKRVTRALEKLRADLGRRGVTTTAAALAGALAASAVQIAPAGLAATLASASLVSAAAGTATPLTLFKVVTMTKLQAGIIGAIVIAGVATPLVIQHQAQVKLRDENAVLRQSQETSAAELQQLLLENEQWAKLKADSDELGRLQKEHLELLRLRGEVTRLAQVVREAKAGAAAQPLTSKNELSETRIETITVTGFVEAPSQYKWFEGMKLTDAIRLSRTLTMFADTNVWLTRSNDVRIEVSLPGIVSGIVENPFLKPGDTVYVPRSKTRLDVDPGTEIRVSGDVLLPSRSLWTNGMKLSDAIRMSGGLVVTQDCRVRIMHRAGWVTEIPSLRNVQMDPVLTSGDSVEIRQTETTGSPDAPQFTRPDFK